MPSKNEKKCGQAFKKTNILRSGWEILFWKAVIQKHLGSVIETSSQCNTAVKSVNLVLENRTYFNRRIFIWYWNGYFWKTLQEHHWVKRVCINRKIDQRMGKYVWKELSISLIPRRNCRVSQFLKALSRVGGRTGWQMGFQARCQKYNEMKSPEVEAGPKKCPRSGLFWPTNNYALEHLHEGWYGVSTTETLYYVYSFIYS